MATGAQPMATAYGYSLWLQPSHIAPGHITSSHARPSGQIFDVICDVDNIVYWGVMSHTQGR